MAHSNPAKKRVRQNEKARILNKAKKSVLRTYMKKTLAAIEAGVKENGGRIVRDTYEFPGGRRFHFTDPSGNELAVWSDR